MGRDFALAGGLAQVAVAAMVPLAACGLTADFSNLQGGTRDAGVPPSAEDGAAEDVEAAAPLDAPAEGGDAHPGFCASLTTPVRFCDDFDEGQAIGDGWDATDVYQGSTAALDFTYYSPPASFLSQIDAASSPGSARLQKDLPIDTPHVHVEFKMLLPQISGQNFELCTLHEPVADGTTYGLFYKYQNGNLLVYVRTLDEDGGENDFVKQIAPPPSGWLDVAIDADISHSATVVVTHGGTVVVNATNVDTSTTNRASMFVELGYYSSNAASAIAHFDDVVVDWK